MPKPVYQSGLRRVAAQCGGLIVKSGGETTRYDAKGRIVRRKAVRKP